MRDDAGRPEGCAHDAPHRAAVVPSIVAAHEAVVGPQSADHPAVQALRFVDVAERGMQGAQPRPVFRMVSGGVQLGEAGVQAK